MSLSIAFRRELFPRVFPVPGTGYYRCSKKYLLNRRQNIGASGGDSSLESRLPPKEGRVWSDVGDSLWREKEQKSHPERTQKPESHSKVTLLPLAQSLHSPAPAAPCSLGNGTPPCHDQRTVHRNQNHPSLRYPLLHSKSSSQPNKHVILHNKTTGSPSPNHFTSNGSPGPPSYDQTAVQVKH